MATPAKNNAAKAVQTPPVKETPLFTPDTTTEIAPEETPEFNYSNFVNNQSSFAPEVNPDDDDFVMDELDESEEDDVVQEADETVYPVLFRLIKQQDVRPMLTLEDGTPLPDQEYPKSYYLPNDAVIAVQDGRKRVNKTIRYIDGEPSIYKEDQSEDATSEFGRIVFVDGIIRLYEDQDPTLIEFLRENPRFAGNDQKWRKKVYEEIKIGQKEKIDLKKVEAELRAVNTAIALRGHDLLLYSKYFNINTKGASNGQLKFALQDYAKKDPEKFMSVHNDPLFKIKMVFLLASDKRIITWKEVPNALCWINGPNRTPIVNLPSGVDPLDHLAEWAGIKEGNTVFNQIKHKVKSVK